MSSSSSPGTPAGSPDKPAVFFADAAEFRAWLSANHDTAPELWMEMRRRGHPDRGLTWADAVPEALCYGWIDSKAEGIDDLRSRQRWTPRRKGSIWSAINVAHVERLIAEGRMAPAGLAAYGARREDRTAVYAFERPHAVFEPDEQAALDADRAASAFWTAATPSYRKLVTNWVTSAKKPETRARRLAQLIDDSAAGRLIPSQRYGATPAWAARASEVARAAGGGHGSPS